MINKKIVSIIPKRETCDTCEHGEFRCCPADWWCKLDNRRVRPKHWCKHYSSLVHKSPTKEKET